MVGIAPRARRLEREGPFIVLRPAHVWLFGEEVFMGLEMLHFETAVPRGR